MMKKSISMTDGPILSLIMAMATPLMFNNFIRTIYNLTDGLYVAQLSSEAFAATAFITPVNAMFVSIGTGLSVAGTTLIARYLGAKDDCTAKKYASHNIILGFVLGIIVCGLGIVSSKWTLELMGATGEFLELCLIYLQINYIGAFFDFIYLTHQSIMNATGNTKVITKINLISAIINVVLDPIFIFDTVPILNIKGLNWGIGGAAVATVIAKIVLFILAYLFIKNNTQLEVSLKTKIDMRKMKDLLSMGFPAAMGHAGSAIGFVMINSIVQQYGTNTIAAQAMVSRISDITMQPQAGIGSALTPIVAQNLGAKKIKRIQDIVKQSMILIIGMSSIASVILYVFRIPILSIFMSKTATEDLWYQAVEYLNYTAFIVFFMGLFMMFNGLFQGVGKTKYSMYMSVGRLWAIRLPFIYLFSQFTNLKATGVWISMLLSNGLIVVYAYIMWQFKVKKALESL